MTRCSCRIFVGVVASLMLACAPKPAPQSPLPPSKVEPKIPPAPSGLRAASGDRSAELRWKTNLAPNAIIGGYSIYVAAESTPFAKSNPEPYPGDTESDPHFESITIDGLENGKVYRAFVVTLAANGAESAPSDTADFLPRLEGRFSLKQSYSGLQGGFSFASQGNVVSDDLKNDLYLTVIKGEMTLASPRRLDAILRQSKFYRTEFRGDLAQPRNWPEPLNGADKITFKIGDLILLRTQEDCYALLRCEGFDSKAVTADFSYIFQTRPRTLRFH